MAAASKLHHDQGSFGTLPGGARDYSTQEIVTLIYHTPEAVDSYLKTFEKLLVLRYYGMPFSAIIRVLGHGRKLIDEHLSIAEKHFPTNEALADYLEARGVALEKI